ncbi:MAG: hypothetical protein CMF62_00180 [Magnetococcales bacterium]|nr:hypothetical protein [Magnetococcales bacterium]|tara:strand:- start:5463 stop:5918 length:456 start_codon:yes stop_codon:yes gene_type:complete
MNSKNFVLKCLCGVSILLILIYLCYALSSSTNAQKQSKPQSETPSENSIESTKSNTITNQNGEIKCYYAPWCGFSRSFLPTWNEFKEYAGNKYPSLKVTTVVCEGETQGVCDRAGIKGYPTVVLTLSNGFNKEYSGQRTVKDISAWVENEL